MQRARGSSGDKRVLLDMEMRERGLVSFLVMEYGCC